MNIIVDCREEASNLIDDMIEQFVGVSKDLEAKKGNNSRFLRILQNVVYMAGIVACIVWAFIYKEISLVPVDTDFGYFVIITAATSSALFLAILVLRNLIEARYYKTIYDGEVFVAKTTRHLKKIKGKCTTYYDLLSDSNHYIDCNIELGEDLDRSINSTKEKIEALEKGKSKVLGGLLSAVYYVAAISVGGFILLYIQMPFREWLADAIWSFGVESGDASSWAEGIFGFCALFAVALGPFFAKNYFNRIKLVTLNDTLIFLIATSTIVAFIVAIIAVAIIAGVIALVVVIVQAILAIIAAIIGIIIVIAIIAGLLSGG